MLMCVEFYLFQRKYHLMLADITFQKTYLSMKKSNVQKKVSHLTIKQQVVFRVDESIFMK